MKVLIVGSGAVGQVLGLYLQKSGVELGFFARPESAKKLEEALEHGGLALYQTTYFRRQDPTAHRLDSYVVVTDLAGSQQFKPDQIWFTTPSTVFYTTWFREFLEQVPCEQVVCFAPEGKRPEFFPVGIDEERWVFGGVTFISWQGGHLGGGGRPGGVNFWLPPLTEIPLVGAGKAPKEVAVVLKKAGLRAAVKKGNFQTMQAALTAMMSAYVVGFELAGWSFSAYRRSPWLKLAARGAREAALGQLPERGIVAKGIYWIITSAVVFHFAAYLLPLAAHFDLEKYLQFHYHKTREQTLNLLDVFTRDAEDRGLPVGHIQLLRQGLLGSG